MSSCPAPMAVMTSCYRLGPVVVTRGKGIGVGPRLRMGLLLASSPGAMFTLQSRSGRRCRDYPHNVLDRVL